MWHPLSPHLRAPFKGAPSKLKGGLPATLLAFATPALPRRQKKEGPAPSKYLYFALTERTATPILATRSVLLVVLVVVDYSFPVLSAFALSVDSVHSHGQPPAEPGVSR